MIVEQVRDRLHNGFQPFALQLSNGRKFAVPHQDFIAVQPRMVVVIDQKGVSHTINPLHIVSLDVARPK